MTVDGFGRSFGIVLGGGIVLLLGGLAWSDNAKAWGLLIGAFIVAETGMLAWMTDARSRRKVFNADNDAAAAVRARTYATMETTAQPGGTAQIPWVAIPPQTAQLPSGSNGYRAEDVADGVTIERG